MESLYCKTAHLPLLFTAAFFPLNVSLWASHNVSDHYCHTVSVVFQIIVGASTAARCVLYALLTNRSVQNAHKLSTLLLHTLRYTVDEEVRNK